ncbi:MAG: hypothetical protein A2506_01165 [Elusimicrobia bacterium RIFOXYD12_FULL_66_9]|nr:MAG: hypothetical protein A2506_01165 [Elusimicrobia bacterium RIFOXYD12_FULL_66_9]
MNPPKPKRILFVCTGNTCRSPMAAVLAERLAKEAGVNWLFSSAGTSAKDGEPLSRGASAYFSTHGIVEVTHSARRLTAAVVAQADEIFTLTRAHRDEIIAHFPEAADKTSVLRESAELKPVDVADPIGTDVMVYEACAASIEEALTILIRRRTHAQDSR